MSILTLPELVAMISTEHDPARRRKIVQLAYIKGEIAGNKAAIAALERLDAKETAHDHP